MISRTRLPTITNAEESLNQIKGTIHKTAFAILRATKPSNWFFNRDTWFWNDDVEMKVRKKPLYYKFPDNKTLANWRIDKNVNREAKKAIPVTRAAHYQDLHDKLDTWDSKICIDLTGPDNIASELWKAKSGYATLWLCGFFNRVIQEGRTPSAWQER